LPTDLDEILGFLGCYVFFIILLHLGCYPGAVVILNLNKT